MVGLEFSRVRPANLFACADSLIGPGHSCVSDDAQQSAQNKLADHIIYGQKSVSNKLTVATALFCENAHCMHIDVQKASVVTLGQLAELISRNLIWSGIWICLHRSIKSSAQQSKQRRKAEREHRPSVTA